MALAILAAVFALLLAPAAAQGPIFGTVAGLFFQAEDGIRDYKVTGVQTCALPISPPAMVAVGTETPLGKSRKFGAVRPCPKDATALATSPGAERPSAVGPRELKMAVWIFSSGRNSKPNPGPFIKSKRIRKCTGVSAP